MITVGGGVHEIHVHASPADDEFDAYLDHAREILATDQPFVAVIALAGRGILPALLRRQLAFVQERRSELIRLCRGLVFVTPVAVARFMLARVLLTDPGLPPTRVVASLGEARAWAYGRDDLRVPETAANDAGPAIRSA